MSQRKPKSKKVFSANPQNGEVTSFDDLVLVAVASIGLAESLIAFAINKLEEAERGLSKTFLSRNASKHLVSKAIRARRRTRGK
jgi:hypothetical protein